MDNLHLVTAPDEDEILKIVSVDGLKKNLRISYDREDAFIQDCLLEAYAWFDGPDGWLRRSLVTQEWRLDLPGFVRRKYSSTGGNPTYVNVPTNCIEIPIPPLQEVTAVRVRRGGVSEIVPATDYDVVTGTLFGTVSLKSGARWPTGIDVGPDAVSIEFRAGYGDGEAVLLKARGMARAIKLLASDYFRNREDTYAEPRLVAVNRKIINGIERIAGRYRIRNDHA